MDAKKIEMYGLRNGTDLFQASINDNDNHNNFTCFQLGQQEINPWSLR